MSFALTTPQILARTKTVTRRMGWAFLKPGDLIQAVEKGMGLKRGEKVNRLAVLRVVNVRTEPLSFMAALNYGPSEVKAEGFGGVMSAREFMDFFRQSHKGCRYDTIVTRIEFEYVDLSAGRSRTGPG